MTRKRPCPECSQWISIDAINCKCGWKAMKEAEQVSTDHRCVYTNLGMRCPLPGTISPSTYASANWYCSGHYQSIGDQKRGLEILMEAEKNFEAIMDSRIHWSIKHVPEEYKKIKKTIRELFLKSFTK